MLGLDSRINNALVTAMSKLRLIIVLQDRNLFEGLGLSFGIYKRQKQLKAERPVASKILFFMQGTQVKIGLV